MNNVVEMKRTEIGQFTPGAAIGEYGLVVPDKGFTQDQLDSIAGLLARVESAGAWSRGDWYNLQEKSMGGRPSETVPNLGTASLKAKCQSLFNKSQKKLITEAATAARFPAETTRRKLTFHHFDTLRVMENMHSIDVDKFIELAYKGDRYEGEFDETQRYRNSPWTATQLKRAIMISVGELKNTESREVNEAEAGVLKDVKAVLDSTNLGERNKAKIFKMVSTEIKGAFGQLKTQFQRQVQEASEKERGELRAERKRLAQERTVWENSNKSIDAILTTEEYKLILGCLHPDKVDAESKKRYAKAFDAFRSLKTTTNIR